jgi:DNA-binding CsgD family transcriptional regulator
MDPACVPGDVAVWSEEFALAKQLFTDILTAAEQRCEPFIIFHAAFSWADGLCRLGQLAESLAFAERAIEAAELVPVTLPLALTGKALTLLEMGRLQEAAALAQRLPSTGTAGLSWYLMAGFEQRLRATLALRRREIEPACQIFARLEKLADSWGIQDPCHIPWAADAISAYLQADRDADASRVVEGVERHAAGLPSRWPRVVASLGHAALAERAGDAALAEASFERALEIQHEMPLLRARTLIEYGAFLCRQGDLPHARPVLAEALRIAEARGAGWYASQARPLWRRAGGRSRRRGTGDLTPQEDAVAQLARMGKTNREIAQQLFLSVNTVETHLRHIYGKLGIHRRWELIARRDRGSGPDSTS